MTRVFRRRSPRDITEILDNMTELYTSAGGIFLGAEYANRDGANERRAINKPCLCGQAERALRASEMPSSDAPMKGRQAPSIVSACVLPRG
ncbi:MAG: hypothetical protein ACO3DQ_06760 [Cephaloticoccus sp.]